MTTIRNFVCNQNSPITIKENSQTTLNFSAELSDVSGISTATINNNLPSNISRNIYFFDIIINSINYNLGSNSVEFILQVENNRRVITEDNIIIEIVIEKETQNSNYILEEESYSIKIDANLNGSIILKNNSLTLNGITINHTNKNFNSTYNLPTGTLSINTGIIKAKDINNNILGTFSSNLLININSNGLCNSQINIDGSDITAHIDEDPHLSQAIFWPDEVIIPNSNDSDILQSTLNVSKIKKILENEIESIENLYNNKNMIKLWNMTLESINEDRSLNILDQYSRDYSRKYPHIFNEGEFIILKTKYNYEVNIEDLDGINNNIIKSTPIMAIIVQNKNSPLLIN